LSESVGEREGEKGTAKRRVTEWLNADEARLRTLVQLTGGNPRTTVLLFHLVLDGLQGGAREYLEQLLDQVTPTYKGQVDELSPQSQQVLDGVALRWDPVTAMEVASESGLDTGVVSTQLTRLVRQGILEKADPGDSKKALYQVGERFFNIWYLMRASRRVRAKLRWFVEFLRVFFDNTQLERFAWDRIERYRPTWRNDPGEVETAFAYLIAAGATRSRCEKYLKENCSDREEIWGPYLDLVEGIADQQVGRPSERPDASEAEIRELIERDPENAAHLVKLGDVLRRRPGRDAEAESSFRTAISMDPKLAPAWAGLGRVVRRDANRREEAESYIRKAIELEPYGARFWRDLGYMLAESTERAAEAEAAYRKAIELDPKWDPGWQGLGTLLAEMPGRETEAEAAHRKAIDIDPNWAWNWGGLAILLAELPGREAEAEVAYRKAIELDPKPALYRLWLGILLEKIPERAAEAEAAYREAIELDGNQTLYWHHLGSLLSRTAERAKEAEATLGRLLAQTPVRAAEAEAAFRKAIELDPQSEMSWLRLGRLLAADGRATEAEAAFREAIELNPRQGRSSTVSECCWRRTQSDLRKQGPRSVGAPSSNLARQISGYTSEHC